MRIKLMICLQVVIPLAGVVAQGGAGDSTHAVRQQDDS